MKNICFLLLLFTGSLEVCSQSTMRLDSILIYEDANSECPAHKHTFQYNNQGQNILSIYGEFLNVGSGCEFVVSEIDSLVYNDLGLTKELYHFAKDDGVISIRTRELYQYDEDGKDTTRYLDVWNPFINNWRKWIRDVNIYSNGSLIENISYNWLEDEGIWTNIFRTERTLDPVTNRPLDQTFHVSGFFSTDEYIDSKNAYSYNDQGHLIEDHFSNYEDSTSTFVLTSIRKYDTDDFGNNLQSSIFRVDTNDVQVISRRTTNSFDTEIEKDDVDLPFSLRSDTSRHISLQSLTETWEDDEWVFNERIEYYYSGLTNTSEPIVFQDLNIFPNPATSTVFFNNMESMEGDSRVQVINADGAIIYTEKLNKSQINIHHLPAGIYSVILQAGNTIFKGNFLKF